MNIKFCSFRNFTFCCWSPVWHVRTSMCDVNDLESVSMIREQKHKPSWHKRTTLSSDQNFASDITYYCTHTACRCIQLPGCKNPVVRITYHYSFSRPCCSCAYLHTRLISHHQRFTYKCTMANCQTCQSGPLRVAIVEPARAPEPAQPGRFWRARPAVLRHES